MIYARQGPPIAARRSSRERHGVRRPAHAHRDDRLVLGRRDRRLGRLGQTVGWCWRYRDDAVGQRVGADARGVAAVERDRLIRLEPQLAQCGAGRAAEIRQDRVGAFEPDLGVAPRYRRVRQHQSVIRQSTDGEWSCGE